MARRCFFSFHYQRDVWRAQQVKNSWVTRDDREAAGFFDSSVFESKRREGAEVLKRFLTEGLKGSSVVCALIGAETVTRRWVRYEIVRGFEQGKGLLGVRVHSLKDENSRTDTFGTNILEHLGYEVNKVQDVLRFKEIKDGRWQWFDDLPTMKYSALGRELSVTNATFSSLFRTYDYVAENGYVNIGTWIEDAAKVVGR